MRQFVARPMYRPETEELRFLPECPRVLRNLPGGEPVLGWVGIQDGVGLGTGSLNLLNLDTDRNNSFPLPGRPGFFVETQRPGVLLIGLERRLVLFDVRSARLTETGVSLPDDVRVIINDGIAIPGGLLFGTKHLECREPIAGLYHFDAATRKVTQLVQGEICSNGKYFIPGAGGVEGAGTEDAGAKGAGTEDAGAKDAAGARDGAELIEIDSPPKKITRYRLRLRRGLSEGHGAKALPDAGPELLEPAPVVAPESLPAIPDGLRPAPGGASIVVAFYNPAAVTLGLAQEIRLADGAVLTEWLFPGSPRVTCPEFAWIDGRVRLIFTTVTEGMPRQIRDIAPEAGTIFRAETPFEAMPEAPPLLAI